MSIDSVGLAFLLVVAAGLSTCLGAALVFISPVANTRILSAALGASAGVMSYVAMLELFAISGIHSFQKAGLSAHLAMRYATFAFFGGMLGTWLLDKAIHAIHNLPKVLAATKEHLHRLRQKTPAAPTASHEQPDMECGVRTRPAHGEAATVESGMVDLDDGTPCSKHAACPVNGADMRHPDQLLQKEGTTSSAPCDSRDLPAAECLDHADLRHLGLLTGVVITLHNVPEGLATFVATMASPSAGVAIAFAIGLHNMPEGIMVAMPIYYATGSKWKGFAWAALSGCAEPLGGLLGYLVLSGTTFNPLGFAIMFAVVAGMMVYISIRELLPTALKYDPEDRVTTLGFVWGMAVMGASLLLFEA